MANISTKNCKPKISLRHIPYNTTHFCQVFCSYLKNPSEYELVDVDEISINKLFVYGIRYQNFRILDWCLYYAENNEYYLNITDDVAELIIKHAKKKSLQWLIDHECDSIRLKCDLPNSIADHMDKELHYQELMIFIMNGLQ